MQGNTIPIEEAALVELAELLETAAFSFETVRMALTIGRRSREAFLSLDHRLSNGDGEEREAGVVALEALDNARGAFMDLAEMFEDVSHEGLGYEIQFWSSFEWCLTRLFDESVRHTGQQALRHELVEATRRTIDLQENLLRVRADGSLLQ